MNYTGFGGGYDEDASTTKIDFHPVFASHPSGHVVAKDVEEPDRGQSHKNAFDALGTNTLKYAGSQIADEVEHVSENMAQHKYASLSNASYDYFNSNGDANAVHKGLTDSKYAYIQDLKDFKVDENLSTIDNVVLHNSTTGETHVSFRGTTDRPVGKTKDFLKDWKINAETAGGSTSTTRMKDASKQMDEVITKYGKSNLSVSGHSAGGGISYQQAVKHDIEGFHYNPAINTTHVNQAGRYAENAAVQNVYKTPLDFASPMAYHKKLKGSNTKVNITQNVRGMDGVVDTHSIEQFRPSPKSVANDVVKVERRTMASSILKGGGEILGAGMTAYSLGEDISKDLKGKHAAEDITIDTAKQAEEYVVDTEILTASLALAPETAGLSVVVGAAGVIINDMVAGHVAEEAKKAVPTIEHALKHTGKKLKKWFGW